MNDSREKYTLLHAVYSALSADEFTYEELRDIHIKLSGSYPKCLYKEEMYEELIKWLERMINSDQK